MEQKELMALKRMLEMTEDWQSVITSVVALAKENERLTKENEELKKKLGESSEDK